MVDVYSLAASLKGIDPNIAMLILALLPIVEPRFALLVGVFAYGMSVPHAFAVSLLGNLILSLILTLTIEWIMTSGKQGILSRIPLVKRIIVWLEEKGPGRASPFIEKYGWIGLIVFVGVPVPLTGVYTGSAVGLLMGMEKKKLFLALFIGGLIAIVITGVSSGLIMLAWR